MEDRLQRRRIQSSWIHENHTGYWCTNCRLWMRDPYLAHRILLNDQMHNKQTETASNMLEVLSWNMHISKYKKKQCSKTWIVGRCYDIRFLAWIIPAAITYEWMNECACEHECMMRNSFCLFQCVLPIRTCYRFGYFEYITALETTWHIFSVGVKMYANASGSSRTFNWAWCGVATITTDESIIAVAK